MTQARVRAQGSVCRVFDTAKPAWLCSGFSGSSWSNLCLAFLVSTLLACASDPPTTPPAALTSVKSTVPLSKSWSVAVGKEDESPANGFSPFLDDKHIYAASSDGEVVSVDQNKGTVVWRRKLETRLVSGVGGDSVGADNEGNVYVATREGEVIALSKADGSTRWTFVMASEVLVPVSASDGLAVARAADGRVTAIDANSGEQIWSATFEPPALTITGYSQPLILNNGVLVGLDDGKLAAMSLDRGQLLWLSVISYPSGRSEIERLVDVDANILVDDAHIYAVAHQGKLAQVEPARGNLNWSVDFSSTAGMTQSAERLFLTDSDSHVAAVDKSSGEVLWSSDKLIGRSLTKPVLIGSNAIAVADFEGYVHALSRDDGRLIGRVKALGSAARGNPQVQGNTLYLQSEEGGLVAVRVPASN